MNSNLLKFKLFIIEQLGEDFDWKTFHEQLGVSSYRLNYLMNERLEEFRFDEIQALAKLLDVHPGILVFKFNVGIRDMTFAQAKELGLVISADSVADPEPKMSKASAKKLYIKSKGLSKKAQAE